MGERAFAEPLWNRTQVGVQGGKAEVIRVAKKLEAPPAKVLMVHRPVNFSHWEPMPDQYRARQIAWLAGDILLEGRATYILKARLLTRPFGQLGKTDKEPEVFIDLRAHPAPLPLSPLDFDPSQDLTHGGG